MNFMKKRIKPIIVIAIIGIATIASTSMLAQSSSALDRPFGTEDSAYYIQVNFAAMRNGESGRQLMEWVNDEILEEIGDELGDSAADDLAQNFDGISIFGIGEDQAPAILTHGYLTEEMQDLLMGHLDDADADIVKNSNHGLDYYTLTEGSIDLDFFDVNTDLGESIYFSLGNLGQGQSLITTSQAAMDKFLANGARLDNELTNDLIVVQANNPLVQGGLNTKHNVFKNGPWESQFFKNVEQLGLVIGDAGDAFSIRAEAISRTPSMAEALGSIAKGLLSFKALATEDNEDLSWLGNLQVSSNDNSTVFELQVPASDLLDVID